MDNIKAHDMLLATLSNPQAKTLDFIGNGVTPENTQLLKKDDYKNKDYIKSKFTDASGKFDEQSFDYAYNAALYNFNTISDERALENLDEVEYEFYDWTRPSASKVRSVDIKYSKDFNYFQSLYNRDHFGSVTESELSLREIAQRGRVHDLETNTWSDKSVNDLGLLTKFFGDTLVYAQWDEDGVHLDPETQNMVKHYAGDWKVDEYGQLYVEKLGKREIYGKQVVNPSDILTTDGSIFNKFDFMDSDGREKSIGKIAAKTIIEIAPLLIPGFNTYYGGVKAAVGLATIMPTFLKSFEGLLLGDSKQYGDDPISAAEGWLYKYRTSSTSDAGSEGMWNIEQMADMVTGIFSQIYEQRAMASLSKYMVRPSKLMDTKTAHLQAKLSIKAHEIAKLKGIDANKAIERAVKNLPELQKAFAKQSNLSKTLSLGYMALTSTSEIYGEALDGGFDRRSAGFAALLAAGGQYGLMMNNRMGDWFLDKTTGYTTEVNKSLIKKSVNPWLTEVEKIFMEPGLGKEQQKVALAGIVKKFTAGAKNFFTGSSVLGEAMLKNAAIEGVEEVTEELVQDMSKGVLDLMSYFGWTKKKGSFGTVERFQSGEWFDDYLANFVGGILGGGLFELEASKISPWIRGQMTGQPMAKTTLYNMYDMIANGHKDDVIKAIKDLSPKLTNQYLSYVQDVDADIANKSEADFLPKDGASQSDLVANTAIKMVEHLEGVLGSEGLILTDDQIINKAILAEIKIDALNKLKKEGKHVGIEGLLLEDYKREAYKAAELKAVIMDYDKASEEVQSKSDINITKDQLKESLSNVKAILNGERNMKYFNMLTVALNPDIQRTFGSLDRYNYIKSKYKVDYNTLQDSVDGESVLDGLTKQEADIEWDEFTKSTDMLGKLEIITKGYVELEGALNETIFKTVDSGYYDIRKMTQNDYMDLNRTIKSFNVASSREERDIALGNFIAINKYLESTGKVKVLPWDSYRTDLAEKFFEEGLIKKNVQGEDGTTITEEYTKEELNTVLAEGKTLRDIISENINNVIGNMPINPFDINLIIAQYNGEINANNTALNKKIAEIEQSNMNPDEKQKEIDFYSKSISNHFIAPITESKSRKTYDATHKAKYEAEVNDLLKSHEKEINKYTKALKFKHVYQTETGLTSYETLLNKHGAENADFTTLTTENKIAFIEDLKESGIFSEVMKEMDNVIGYEDLVNNYLAKLDGRESLDSTEETFEEEFFEKIKGNIESVTGILGNTDIQKRIDKAASLGEQYEQNAAKEMPDMFKMHNYAFDFLVDALSKGHYDNEMYLEAKKMFSEELEMLAKKLLPEADNLPMEVLEIVMNDPKLDLGEEFTMFAYNDLGLDADNTYKDYIETYQNAVDNEWIDAEGIEKASFIHNLVVGNFNPAVELRDIAKSFTNFRDNLVANKQVVQSLQNFQKLNKDNMVANPIYDMLRSFNMQMDSNPKSKVNTIFEIAAKEEKAYRASSGADAFITDNIRVRDLQQAINTIDMFNTVVNAMSTTQRFGDDFNGFLAMRQDFAKKYDIKDPVTDLKTINSDQAAVMSLDLQRLKTRLEFIKTLSEDNQKKKGEEQKAIGEQAHLVHIKMFQDLEGVRNLTPDNFKDILNSNLPPNKKIVALETAFYDHNKDVKEKAFEDILKYHLKGVSTGQLSTYTRETTSSTLSPYTKAVYFASKLNIRAEDHIKRQKISIQGDFNKAPFYIQEYVSTITKASIINPEMFANIFNIKQDKTKDMADFITFILGGTGTGKTTVAAAQVLDIIRQTNDNSNVWLAGPTMKQANKLHKDTIDAIGNKNLNLTTVDTNKLFELFGEGIKEVHNQIKNELKDISNSKNTIVKLNERRIDIEMKPEWASLIDYSKLPNLLVFDEVTHLSKPEILLLNFISKASYNNGTGNFFKVVGTGDINQLGYQVDTGGGLVEFNIGSLNAVYTPYMTASIRSNNNQKKANADMSLGLVTKANQIYNLESAGNGDYARADLEIKEFLDNVNNETGLSHYFDGTKFRGDYIAKNYTDIRALETIKNNREAQKQNGEPISSVGVLTTDGKLGPSMIRALLDAGFSQDFLDTELEVYSLKNVQGTEVDYFIFDMGVLPKYDRLKDKLKAFYTFTMRSTEGTVIFDTTEDLKNSLNITNAKMSESSIDFEVLGERAVKELKEQRIEEIDSIVDNAEISEEDDFKWRTGKSASKSEVTIKKLDPSEGLRPPSKADDDGLPGERKRKVLPRLVHGADGEAYKALVHSFIHNPNVQLDYDGGRPVSLKSNALDIKLDLNSTQDIKDADKLESVITQWAQLRSALFRSGDTKASISNYPDFFAHIFGNRTSDVEVSYVTTAKFFDPKINTPMQLHAADSKGALKKGDILRTVAAKLTSGKGANQKVHYITLAAFPTLETLKNEGFKYLQNAAEVGGEILSEFNAVEGQIEAELKKLKDAGKQAFMEIGQLDPKDIELITSTLLDKKNKVSHSLVSLKYAFPGMYVSEIRIFPTDPTDFKNVINTFTYGEQRTDEQIEILRTGLSDPKDPNSKRVHNAFGGKPYIVVSYANDVSGRSGTDTSARFVMVTAKTRKMPELVKEIHQINKKISNAWRAAKAAGENFTMSESINALQETLLDRTQILDILIQWGNTVTGDETLLDTLTKEVTIGSGDKAVQKSVLDIMSRFTNETGGDMTRTSRTFSEVVEVVKKHTNEKYDPKTSKQAIIAEITGKIGWIWDFKNLFTYQQVIANAVRPKAKLDHFTVKDFQNLSTLAESLMKSIEDIDFYYSIPIKPDGAGKIAVNKFISGKNGFSPEFFGDKFYINVNPQSERALIPLNYILRINPENEVEGEGKTPPPPPPGGGRSTGRLVTTSFTDFFSHFNGLPRIFEIVAESNSGLEANLTRVLHSYSNVSKENLWFEPSDVTFKEVVKLAGLKAPNAASAIYTVDNLIDFLIGDASKIPKNQRKEIQSLIEQLFNQTQEQCPAPAPF